jgi:hypothetical protein
VNSRLTNFVRFVALVLALPMGCAVNKKHDLATSPRRFANFIRSDPRVAALPIEFGFTPPVPLSTGSDRVVVFAYRTPRLPNKGFVLLAPEYRIEADYGKRTVLDIRQVSPSDAKLSGDELGPIQSIYMSFEEIERMDRDFDAGYERLMRAFIDGHAVSFDLDQRRRMQEIVPIIIDPRFWPMLAHESPLFTQLLRSSIAGP